MDPSNPHNLTPKQFAFVAAYLGSCKGNATKAAIEAGYSPKTATATGHENLSKPKIQSAIAGWREEVKTTSLRELDGRLAKLEDLESRLWRVIDARAEQGKDGPAGADTGLLIVTTTVRVSVTGDTSETHEYAYDSAIVRDLSGVYAQISKETGADKLKLEVSGPNGGPVQVSSDLMVDIVTNQLEHSNADDLEALAANLDRIGVQAVS